jgi:hypothetical protein
VLCRALLAAQTGIDQARGENGSDVYGMERDAREWIYIARCQLSTGGTKVIHQSNIDKCVIGRLTSPSLLLFYIFASQNELTLNVAFPLLTGFFLMNTNAARAPALRPEEIKWHTTDTSRMNQGDKK